MRRIIHNTTAIAACLSLLAPHAVLAQSGEAGQAPQDQQQPQAADQQAQQPVETQAEQAPQQQPEAQAAACADGSAPPCAEAAPAAQAEPSPEVVEQEAAPAATPEVQADPQLAPAAPAEESSAPAAADAAPTEPPLAEPADTAQPKPRKAAKDAPSAAPAEATAPVEQAEPQPMTAEEPVEGTAQQVQEDTKAPAPKAAPTDDGLADALAKEADKAASPAPAEKPEDAGATTPPAAESAPLAQENAGQAGGKAAPQGKTATDADALAEKNGEAATTPEEPAPVATTPAEPAPLTQENAGKTGDEAAPQGEPSTDADALAKALAEKNGETATTPEEPAPVATTPAEPAPLTQENAGQTGDEAAPQGEPSTDADALAKALAEKNGETAATPEEPAPAATAPQAGQPAQPVAEAPAPEQGAKETEAAKEAAAAEEVAPVAALSEEGGGEVTEEQVTEDNSRSSAEDFATDLRNAMTAATGQPREAARDKDDDKSDLAKALLFGLGGVAVGSMLNNNRQVTLSTPDRVVVTRDDGSQQVIKDEVALLRQPGSTVATENYADGSSRTIVTRADGSKIVTIRDADLRVLRRNLVSADGTTVQLIDDTVRVDPVDIASLPAPAAGTRITPGQTNEEELRAALFRESDAGRRFTLSQIRNIAQVRALAAPVNIDAITFETGSAAIQPDQAEQLSALGKIIRSAVAENPREVFLVEGHTDTVGSDAANLALSDRRAESVALALTEYFEVPPENMVVQGYGEQFPKVRQEGDVRENRRAAIRRITDLLPQSAQ